MDWASSGVETLTQLQSNGIAKERYDLIFMDMNMPEMDGCETTTRIRELPKYAKVPIIGVTGNVIPNEVEKCHAVGMNVVLSKPIMMNELISTLNQFFIH